MPATRDRCWPTLQEDTLQSRRGAAWCLLRSSNARATRQTRLGHASRTARVVAACWQIRDAPAVHHRTTIPIVPPDVISASPVMTQRWSSRPLAIRQLYCRRLSTRSFLIAFWHGRPSHARRAIRTQAYSIARGRRPPVLMVYGARTSAPIYSCHECERSSCPPAPIPRILEYATI